MIMRKGLNTIVRRRDLYSQGLVLLLFAIAGCVTPTPPTPAPDQYIRVAQVDGCWQHTAPRDYNIALGASLEQLLRTQLAGRVIELPQCWYEEYSGKILLVSGEACDPHDEFRFQKEDGMWTLVRAERQDLVTCHERRRK